jgi:hypothetical protein
MGEKQTKSDKPTRKVAPPIIADPKLEKKVEAERKAEKREYPNK